MFERTKSVGSKVSDKAVSGVKRATSPAVNIVGGIRHVVDSGRAMQAARALERDHSDYVHDIQVDTHNGDITVVIVADPNLMADSDAVDHVQTLKTAIDMVDGEFTVEGTADTDDIIVG